MIKSDMITSETETSPQGCDKKRSHPRPKKLKGKPNLESLAEEEDSSLPSDDISLERKGIVKSRVQPSSVILQSDVFFPTSQLSEECLKHVCHSYPFYERQNDGLPGGHQGNNDSTHDSIGTMVGVHDVIKEDAQCIEYRRRMLSDGINTAHTDVFAVADNCTSQSDGFGSSQRNIPPKAHQGDKSNLDAIISSLSVLVVDDSLVDRKMSQKCLSGEYGQEMWVVHTAVNGEMALQYCSSSSLHPDVIIIDQNMESAGGIMLGTEVVKNLRANYGLRDVIIIGCTGFGDVVKESFLSSGCDAVWQKPIPNRDEAMAHIRNIRYKRALSRSPEDLGAVADYSMNKIQLRLETQGDSQWNKGVGSVLDSVLRKENLESHKKKNFAWSNDWSHIPRLTSYICNPSVALSEDDSSDDDSIKPPQFIEIRSVKTDMLSDLSCSVNEMCDDASVETQSVVENESFPTNKNSSTGDICKDVDILFGVIGNLGENKVSHGASHKQIDCGTTIADKSDNIKEMTEDKWDPISAFRDAFTKANASADKLCTEQY